MWNRLKFKVKLRNFRKTSQLCVAVALSKKGNNRTNSSSITISAFNMSKFDVSDFDADELNQGIDDTNFPSSRHASISIEPNTSHLNNDEEAPQIKKSLPMAVKPNGFAKSFDDDVFDSPGTPKTPRSLPTPGNCECKPFSNLNGAGHTHTYSKNYSKSEFTVAQGELVESLGHD